MKIISGKSLKEVANTFLVNNGTVRVIYSRYKKTGLPKKKHKGGSNSKLTETQCLKFMEWCEDCMPTLKLL